MSRARLGACVIAAVALVASACGSRVEPLGEGFAGPGLPTAGVATDASGNPIPVATDSAGVVIPGVTPTGGATGSTNPILPPGPANCRGGKSDAGVTSSTIKIGSVISLTGPLPGQFNAARDAVDSYFKAVNEAGGICGRRIELLVRDDGGDTSNNTRVTRQLLEEDKVFAFVGSHSANDDGMAGVLCNKPIPDIAFPLGWKHTECPNAYGVPGQIQRRVIGEGASGTPYLNRTNGIKKIALFWLQESEVSILSAWAFEAAAIKADSSIEVCYEQQTGVFEQGFFQYVNSMKDRCDPNVTAVYTTMENNSNIRLAKAMDSQGFKPKVFATTFTSYLPSYIAEAEGTTEGAYMAMPQIPFERCAERSGKPVAPCQNAELERYVNAVNRYHPNSPRPGSFGAPAWGQAALFSAAAQSCGANLTRRCVLDYLETTGPFTANGLLSPTRPGDHKVYSADLLVQVRNGRFVEVPPPPGAKGPPEQPEFWDDSELFDWWNFYCANRGKFINTSTKDKYIKCS